MFNYIYKWFVQINILILGICWLFAGISMMIPGMNLLTHQQSSSREIKNNTVYNYTCCKHV